MKKIYLFSIVIAFSVMFFVSLSLFAKGDKDKGGEASGGAEPAEEVGLPYEGVTLNVACLEGLTAYPWREYAQRWAKENGAKVNVVAFSFNNYYESLMTELITGGSGFDLIDHPAFWIGDLWSFSIPLDDYIAEKDPEWDDYLPAYKKIFNWGGKIYSLQFDGDVWMLVYRRDLFEHPEEMANFKAKYGYDLAPPDTWDQYYEIAEFFTRKAGDKLAGETIKQDFAGHVEVQKRGGGMGTIWAFLSHFVSYLDTPGGIYSGDIYFDPETMQPRINNPAGVRAIEDLIKGADPSRSVPGALSVDWSLLGDLYVTGQVAMAYAWPDMGPWSLDPNRSKIIGKAGFATIPGSKEVWDLEQEKWVDWDGTHKGSVLAWGKGIAIMKTSKDPDAAYDLARYMVVGELAIEEAINADDGLDPYRYSQFKSQKVADAYSEIPTYFPALEANITNGVPDLKIPQTVAYYDVIELWVDKAKRGEISPKEALERAEKDMERITDSAGRIKQNIYYKQSLGMTQ